ncbi:flagellar assembly protein FliH [Pantoea agglomerans]|jgi:flagellar assembly protein FliH|uniref:flagellar assembly protein FliH n=1 Tax=Enterobacter agglomerans TaxID=549 RepID=UPI001F5B17A1|nr:flagellar assembly protein FliH [Pantoea agglomerans]MDQ0431107.1 flagellar assembly protein FliH [Pantoea agglomerans]
MMPTFDDIHAAQWQPWQPVNLLSDEPAETKTPLPSISEHSDEQFRAELARLRKQAEEKGFSEGRAKGEETGRSLGYEAGLAEGRETGRAQAQAEAHQAQLAVLQQAEQVIQEFRSGMESLESLIPSRLVQLALSAVKQLYGTQNIADNAALMDQIRLLIKQDGLLHGSVKLFVSPLMHESVSEALGNVLSKAGWILHTDENMAPGGCRVISDDAEYDASFETRWKALCQCAQEELGS